MIERISDFIISLLPSNAVVFIIYLAGITLFSVAFILILSRKKPKKNQSIKQNNNVTIDNLLEIANNPKSTLNDLIFTLEYFFENFKIKENKKKSFELFKKVLNHKNRSKKVFDIFHGKILPANLDYKEELNELEKKALNNK